MVLAGNLSSYNPSHYGITVGGDEETCDHGFWQSPALRHTRWAKDTAAYSSVLINPNAVEAVFGVLFPRSSEGE